MKIYKINLSFIIAVLNNQVAQEIRWKQGEYHNAGDMLPSSQTKFINNNV